MPNKGFQTNNRIGDMMLKSYSASDIINYLEQHYLTIDQLADQAHISSEQLDTLIANACIPKHSHQVRHQIVFRTEIFGDTTITQQDNFYYHSTLVKWAVIADQYSKTLSLCEVANKIKADFVIELRQALIEIDGARQAFDYCFDDSGNLLDIGIDKIMKEHWPYIMDGTYGVCLKSISAKNILIKTMSVSVLEKWVNGNENKNKKAQHSQTILAAELYDSVTSCFGPHEISKSTRDRLYSKFKESSASSNLK